MEVVKYELDVPKESKEVVDAAVDLLMFFVQKKPLAELPLLLPDVLAALDGAASIKDEVSSSGKEALAGYAVYKFWSALQPPAPPAA